MRKRRRARARDCGPDTDSDTDRVVEDGVGGGRSEWRRLGGGGVVYCGIVVDVVERVAGGVGD